MSYRSIHFSTYNRPIRLLTTIFIVFLLALCDRTYSKLYRINDFKQDNVITTFVSHDDYGAMTTIQWEITGTISDTITFYNNKIAPDQLPIKIGPGQYYGGYEEKVVITTNDGTVGEIEVKVSVW
ncbi:MAG: hypothetical protein WBA16_10510 [Nonlabens sp.]